MRTIICLALSSLLLHACNGQPTSKAPVVITNDTVPIPTNWPLPLEYEGQLCHYVRNMHQDKSGTLWFGTNHYGLIHYANDTLEYLADSAGITTGRISGRYPVGRHGWRRSLQIRSLGALLRAPWIQSVDHEGWPSAQHDLEHVHRP